MSSRTKIREITITQESGAFNSFFKRLTGSSSEESMDFDSLSMLRRILSNEKARLINTIKTKSPKSIYELAKMLNRDFKSVSDDIKLLQRFGIIEMLSENSGKRQRLRPTLSITNLTILIKL